MTTKRSMPTTRRGALLAAAAGTALAAGCASPGTAPARTGRAPIVLLHGAWHGSWCWARVRPLLTAAGHEVFTPTFTGMGDRHHLSSAAVNLDTHVRDLVAAVQTEELRGAIVVAHSYAGYPATAALPRLAGAVSRLVYLDALLPSAGRASSEDWPPQALAGVMATLGEGFRLASFPPAAFGVPETHPEHAWLKRRLTDMPIGPLTQKVPADCPPITRLPVPAVYIRCTQNSLGDSRNAAQRAAAAGMRVVDLDTGHDAMLTAPAALAQQLLAIAREA